MRGRVRLIVMAALMSFVVLGISGFRQLTLTRLQAGPWIVEVPLGTGRDEGGRATGIDGRSYGPLTFVTNGTTTVVSDTYHERLLYFRHGHMTSEPVKGQMIEAMAMDAFGQVLAADNRSLALWLISAHGAQRIIQIPHQSGFSEALWHIGIGARNNILVDWVKVGQGIFATQLIEYTDKGQFIRSIASTEMGQPQVQTVVQATLAAPIRSFQVAPNGDIYVQPEGVSIDRRVIRIYRPNGIFAGRVIVRSPEPIDHADFLGIGPNGWIYLAVNINVPHKARVLVVDKQGSTIMDSPISAVPVYAQTYGCVLRSGILYLDQSTASSYRIREYHPVKYHVWRWVGL